MSSSVVLSRSDFNLQGFDLELKAKNASKWLKEGNRVKIDLFLPGRAKYMDFNFLKERLGRILKLITEDYKISDGPSKSMKGITVMIERGSKPAAKPASKPAEKSPQI